MTTNNDTTTTATDLVAAKTALDKLTKSLAKNDLDDFLRGERRSLLLVDVSSSMSEPIRAGGTKISALRVVVASMRETHPVPVAAFGGAVGVIVVDSIPSPSGGTPLTDAIQFGQREGATHLVVVTDGYPDNPHTALDAAREFGRPIDVVYIGDGNDEGSRFAAELARITGGTCSLTDLGKPKELAGKIVLMLGDGTI